MEDCRISLQGLDKVVILEILRFLSLEEIKSIAMVSSFLHECCKSDYLYKDMCNYLFPMVSSSYFLEFQARITQFTRISKSFYKILSFLKENNAGQLYNGLKSTSNPKLLSLLNHYHCEQNLGQLSKTSAFYEVPKNCASEELFWTHLLYNGQGVNNPGLFGSYEFYDVYVSLPFLSNGQVTSPTVISTSGEARSRLIIFTDTENRFGNGHNSIYCTTNLRNKILYLASSFTEYLESYTARLLTNQLRMVDGKILLYEYNQYSSTNSENGIKITATALFIPHLSEEQRYLWSYLITIEEDNPEKAWILTTRTWRIEDANGGVQTVDRQPGVIGLYPKVHKGSEPTQYSSCCYLKTPSGRMSGFFSFRDIHSPREIDVQIPTFLLELPLGSRLINSA